MFSSTWGVGHVFPMVPLARAFAAAGHEVLWVANEQACAVIRAAGLDAQPGGLDKSQVADAEGRLRAATATMPGPERAGFAFPTMFGEWATPAMVADLLPLARHWGPELMIHEPAEHAAALVAAVLGVRCVTHSWGGAIPAELLAAAGERIAWLWAEHGLTVPDHAGAVTSTYLDICPPSGQPVALDHIPLRQPLRPMRYSGEPGAPVPGFPGEAGSPWVHVSMGTLHNRSPAMTAAVSGVAAASERGSRCRVLVTVGANGDPAALGPQPPGVLVERWISQSEILPHAAVVVSHGGSGDCLGAWGHGLPQLCLPQAADQFRNAGAVTASGSGLMLEPAQATQGNIENAVRRLLAENDFRDSAADIAAQIAAMPLPEEVVSLLVGPCEPADELPWPSLQA